jgi:hypothetical protein
LAVALGATEVNAVDVAGATAVGGAGTEVGVAARVGAGATVDVGAGGAGVGATGAGEAAHPTSQAIKIRADPIRRTIRVIASTPVVLLGPDGPSLDEQIPAARCRWRVARVAVSRMGE